MHIIPLAAAHISGASALFAASFRRLRCAVPILPAHMEDPAACAEELEVLLARSAGLVAMDGDQLAGYLGWWIVDGFRDTPRRAAYVPVWAHTAAGDRDGRADIPARQKTTLALYASAARIWFEAGCQVHAASLLAGDPLVHSFWFWNGFGAMVVDAVRATGAQPAAQAGQAAAPASLAGAQERAAQVGIRVRRAVPDDAALVARLEAEHWRHYAEPPVLMVASHPSGEEEVAALIADPRSRVWLAFASGEAGEPPAGYMRFEGGSSGASELVAPGPEEDPGLRSSAITGAYVRPAFRGRGAAPAMLSAALDELAASGCPRCSVDFESFNPEASALWMKYFTPVSISVMRVPERS